MEKIKLMPENVLKFSAVDDNEQHPDILSERHKMTGIDRHSYWFPL